MTVADCLFCRIAAGEVPAALVFESPAAVAFLDRFPAARGHTLVVPRIHAATLQDLPDEAIGGLFQAVKGVTGKLLDALQPMAFHIGWNHGEAAGQQVFHLHVHLLPRFAPGRGIQSLGSGAGSADLAEMAAAIRKA